MRKQKANTVLILLVTAVFTFVNVSAISSVFCSMKDTSSCCCKQKTEKKSCCANKKEVKFTSHCGCEMKETKTDPAELTQIYTTNNISKTLKIFTPSEIVYSPDGNIKVYSSLITDTQYTPPGTDINTLKCLLRI